MSYDADKHKTGYILTFKLNFHLKVEVNVDLNS